MNENIVVTQASPSLHAAIVSFPDHTGHETDTASDPWWDIIIISCLGHPKFDWELQMGVMEGMAGLWFSQPVFL